MGARTKAIERLNVRHKPSLSVCLDSVLLIYIYFKKVTCIDTYCGSSKRNAEQKAPNGLNEKVSLVVQVWSKAAVEHVTNEKP